MTGEVDNHYLKRYGAAVALSVIGGGASFLQNWGFGQGERQQTSVSHVLPDGTVVTTTTNDASGLQNDARQAAADTISQNLTAIAQDALENQIHIPPTIHVDQGERIIVFLRRDLDFSALYPDPVIEALKDIKRERRLSADGLSK